MEPTEKQNAKEEIRYGVFFSSLFLSFLILALIAWPPISYYMGKWYTYWANKDLSSTQISGSTDYVSADYWDNDSDIYINNMNNALIQCDYAARNYFGTDEFDSDASSTSDDYSTYDCYGAKLVKIPINETKP